MIGPQQPTTKPTPVPPPRPKAEPELQVAPSRGEFKLSPGGALDLGTEMARVLQEPGDKLNLMSGKKFREVRSQLDLNVPYTGVHAQSDVAAPSAQDVPNPDSPDGKWDPTQYLPRMVFDKAEDAFPVAPDFDGDTDTHNNAPSEADGADGHYKDGVIGGDQALSAGFTATKKGEYTILTYSFYHAHNKAGDYHQNDYSTVQVYLKPGADGKLEPTHLMTSWHHGAVLTQWDDLAKDADGRPVVKVNLGSHALEVMDKGASVPKDGLQITADGTATLNGQPTGHSLHFDALQTNVKGARYLDPASEAARPRVEAMRWGEAAMNPFLPDVFADAKPVWQESLERGGRILEGVVDKAVDKAEGVVEDGVGLVKDGVGAVKDGAEKVGGVVEDGADEVKDAAVDGWNTIKGLL